MSSLLFFLRNILPASDKNAQKANLNLLNRIGDWEQKFPPKRILWNLVFYFA